MALSPVEQRTQIRKWLRDFLDDPTNPWRPAWYLQSIPSQFTKFVNRRRAALGKPALTWRELGRGRTTLVAWVHRLNQGVRAPLFATATVQENSALEEDTVWFLQNHRTAQTPTAMDSPLPPPVEPPPKKARPHPPASAPPKHKSQQDQEQQINTLIRLLLTLPFQRSNIVAIRERLPSTLPLLAEPGSLTQASDGRLQHFPGTGGTPTLVGVTPWGILHHILKPHPEGLRENLLAQ